MKSILELFGSMVCAIKGKHEWNRAHYATRPVTGTHANDYVIAKQKICARCGLTRPVKTRARKAKVAE